MENTLENKAKFFAQYWGFNETMVIDTFMGRTNILSVDYVLKEHSLHSIFKDYQLLLKPLSSITDEDAIEVAKIFNQHKIKAHYSDDDLKAYLINKGKQFAFRCEHYVIIYQYLQSKGYALPYMGLSVEQLVEYGWVKLT